MRKFILAAGAAVLAMGATALLSTPGEARDRPAADADGSVSRAEARASAAAAWTRLDVNNDGVLNPADRGARQAQRFAALDKDRNGQVTFAELEAARAERRAERFARLDADRSGGLSAAELAAGGSERRGHWKGHGDRHDGHGLGGERGRGEGMRGRHGRMMGLRAGKQADADGDGSITRAEFDAAAELRFATADANKDGSVTKDERRAARARMRAQAPADKPAAGN